MGWSRPPSGFADELEKLQNQRLRAAALQALTGVIERSPVDSGAFRGNNRVGVGAADNSVDLNAADGLPKGATNGVQAFDEGFRIIGQANKAFDVIYISNNLPYAGELENGSSTQAPQGVYAVTFNNLREASGRDF